ncbi:MAG TPA: Dickkopf N-terminal cysteine-rich domain-containing protein [Polyangiales bacterium]|nr:Dickkopf N-terminal cysteine-rich domain-containing protein [Polyangiales bacterium]
MLLALVSSACEIEEGNFDGSFFEDGSIGEDEDAGADEDDAGKPTRDSGTPTKMDAAVDKDAGPTSDLKPSDVPAVLARGRCKALESCMGKSLLRDAYEGNDCVTFVTRQLQDRHLHWLDRSIAAGHVTFRPDRLDDCEKDLAALGCDVASRPLPDSCEAAVEGKADVNQDCWIDQDCKGTGYCDKGDPESCPGKCKALQAKGSSCSASAQCASGLVCNSGMCGEPLSEGDSCATRMGSGACPPGLVCQGKSGSLVCQSVKTLYVGKLNESCDALGKLCESGLVCESASSGDTSGVCKPLADKGGQCRRAEPNQCPPDQYCKSADFGSMERVEPGVSGVCWDRPRDQESCATAGVGCVPGARCINDLCRSLKSAGQTCGQNAECYGGSCESFICVITTIECK